MDIFTLSTKQSNRATQKHITGMRKPSFFLICHFICKEEGSLFHFFLFCMKMNTATICKHFQFYFYILCHTHVRGESMHERSLLSREFYNENRRICMSCGSEMHVRKCSREFYNIQEYVFKLVCIYLCKCACMNK